MDKIKIKRNTNGDSGGLIMAKYVIEIPDEVKCIQYTQQTGHGTINLKVKSVGDLTPYTEPDEDKSYGINRYKVIGLAFLKWLGNDVGDKLKSADDVYRFLDKNCYNKDAVEQGVWEFAGEFFNADREVETLFSCDLDDVYKVYTYSEAKAKYEKWLKEKDEIHVGCEVYNKYIPELKIYVTDMDDNSFGGFALCKVGNLCDYGDRFSECDVHQYKPTGRMLPNIVQLLNKMQEE